VRFLFLTDFHGNHSAYKRAFKAARDLKVDAVINGGDTLPKSFARGTPFAKEQDHFLKNWLIPKVEKLRQDGIDFYMMFGNDDAKGIIKTLDKADEMKTLIRLDGKGWLPLGDHWVLGLPWVPDYPFGLKDWCCGDTEAVPNPVQFGGAVVTDQFHFIDVERPWAEEIADRPTLADRIAALPPCPDPAKGVFVMHCPPAHGGLDKIARTGECVGSKAGLAHIAEVQYRLSLHGHIHEAPRESGHWFARIGDTLAVNPGALPPHHVVVDLEAGTVEHHQFGEVRI